MANELEQRAAKGDQFAINTLKKQREEQGEQRGRTISKQALNIGAGKTLGQVKVPEKAKVQKQRAKKVITETPELEDIRREDFVPPEAIGAEARGLRKRAKIQESEPVVTASTPPPPSKKEPTARLERSEFAEFSKEIGETFKELGNFIGDFNEATQKFNIDDEFRQKAKEISLIEDRAERTIAFKQLADESKKITDEELLQKREATADQRALVEEEAGIVPPTPEEISDIKAPAQEVGPNLNSEVQTQATIQKSDEAIPNVVSSYSEFNLGNLTELLGNPDEDSASIYAQQLAKAKADAPQLFLSLGKSQRELQSYLKQIDNAEALNDQKRELIRTQKDSQLSRLEDLRTREANNVTDSKNMMNKQVDSAKKEIEKRRKETVQDLQKERANAESMVKAQIAMGSIPGGTWGLNKIASALSQYDEAIRKANQEFDSNIDELTSEQSNAMLDYAKAYNDIDFEITGKSMDVLNQYNASVVSINADEAQLDNEKIQAKDKAFFGLQEQLSSIISFGGQQLQAEAQAKQTFVNAKQKAIYDHMGISHFESNGVVTALTDDLGNPLLTRKKAMASVDFFDNLDLPKKDENLNAWALKWKGSAQNRFNIGEITADQYNNIIQEVDNIKSTERVSFSNSYYSNEGAWTGAMNPMIAKNLESAVDGSFGGQCVKFVRDTVPAFFNVAKGENTPSGKGLWTMEDKNWMIDNTQGGTRNIADARDGGVAVIDVGNDTGHIATIQSKNDDGTVTIRESNYSSKDTIGTRTGTPEELGIVGYWNDPAETNQQQIQIEGLQREAVQDSARFEVASPTIKDEIIQKHINQGTFDVFASAAGIITDPDLSMKVERSIADLPTRLRDNVAEGARYRKLAARAFSNPKNAGKSDEQIIAETQDILANFTIKEDSEFKDVGTNLRDLVFGTELEPKVIARLINKDNPVGAILKVEKELLKDVDTKMGELSARVVVEKSAKATRLVKNIENRLGPITGQFNKQSRKFKNDPAFVELEGVMIDLIALKRNQLSGSAVTPNEEKFLEPLIPSVSEPAENVLTKLNVLSNTIMLEHNQARETAGLPRLTNESLLDRKLRVNLYRDEGNSEPLTAKEQVPQVPQLSEEDSFTRDRAFESMQKLSPEAMDKLGRNNVNISRLFQKAVDQNLDTEEVENFILNTY